MAGKLRGRRNCFTRAEGLPLKNLTVRAGDESVSGELLITRYGFEGGAIYRLGRTLRRMKEPRLEIDFKPQLSADNLRERAAGIDHAEGWFRAWKLSGGAIALLETIFPNDCADHERMIATGEEFCRDATQSATDCGSNFIGRRRALGRTR